MECARDDDGGTIEAATPAEADEKAGGNEPPAAMEGEVEQRSKPCC